MAWSTQQLAEPVGTTVNTIRHDRGVDLLEEPECRHVPREVLRQVAPMKSIELTVSRSAGRPS